MLELSSSDRKVLRLLGPLFLMLTASNVVTMSFAKALYIGHNEFESLPVMFIGASTFTAFASLVYIHFMGRWNLVHRFIGLLIVAIVSFGILGVLVPLAPESLSLFVFTWCTGMGHLLLIQAWGYSTTTLPVRAARRLFPALAALATLGAVLGGFLTAALIPFGELGSLLLLSVILLFGALVFLFVASKHLQEATSRPGREDPTLRKNVEGAVGGSGTKGGLLLALRNLRDTPLMRDLALLAIFLQVASVIMDLQFSSALKLEFGTEEMASFLGTYYALANMVTFFVALVAGRRIAQMVGIGLASGSAAVILALGAIVSSVLVGFGVSAIFWGVAITSFGERVVSFGIGKHAFNAAMTPVDAREAERVKFLIDGVGLRIATVIVSASFMVLSVDLQNVAGLSPLLGIMSVAALFFAFRVAPTYRSALLEALRSNQLEPVDADTYRTWARREAQLSLERLLTSDIKEEIMSGLAVCEEFELPMARSWRKRLLESEDTTVIVRCLQVAALRKEVMDGNELRHLLKSDLPPAIIREALRNLPAEANECIPLVDTLAEHSDPLVACQSLIWLRPHRRSAAQSDAKEMRKRLRWTHVERRVVGAAEPEKIVDAGEEILERLNTYLSKLPSLLGDPDPAVRDEALSAMSAMKTPILLEPLLNAIDSPDTGHAATMALVRIGKEVVEPRILARLNTPLGIAVKHRIRLIRLAELLSSIKGVTSQLDSSDEQVRDAAVSALWRLARKHEGSTIVEREAIIGQALADITELVRLAQVDSLLKEREGDRLGFLRHEVALRRSRGERRVFKLLGLIYGRRNLHRAYTHCRSAFARTRSNAIELLENAIRDRALLSLVAYVEASEFKGDKTYTKEGSEVQLDPDAASFEDPLLHLLPIIDQRLSTLYRWALLPPEATTPEDPMNRVFLLHSIPLFNSTPADQLLAISQICQEAHYAAGEVVFGPGEPATFLYLIERGRIEILRERRPVTSFGPAECFGELAILDDASRNVTARATEDTDCLIISREDFQGLLAISPDLSRGTIATLTQRLRSMLKRMN
jgi:CRP/FNR family cyclic AMP-dependent transcriptional regulator